MPALCRKRPSPLESGREKSWAGGIIYTLGRLDYLFDQSTEPYMDLGGLCEKIGVGQSNASVKPRETWRRLDLMPMHSEWCLPSKLDDNLLVWIVEVDGLPVDARAMPKEVREEAHRLGLIPHMP